LVLLAIAVRPLLNAVLGALKVLAIGFGKYWVEKFLEGAARQPPKMCSECLQVKMSMRERVF